MTESREFNASTVEEALSKASGTLEIPVEELSYEVLDSGSDGFLGIGARDARVVISIERDDDAGVPVETEDMLRKSPTLDSYSPPENDDPPAVLESHAGEKMQVPEELVEEIEKYVSSIVEAMGLDSRVDVYDTGDYIAVDISTDHTALLIGQKGETIDSLQYLVNASVYRDREFLKRIVLDSEGYRQRRVEAIQGMAHRTARKSVREQRNIKMPPMNSSERRVVHVYLKDNSEVTTFSEGSGDERRVTVSPN